MICYSLTSFTTTINSTTTSYTVEALEKSHKMPISNSTMATAKIFLISAFTTLSKMKSTRFIDKDKALKCPYTRLKVRWNGKKECPLLRKRSPIMTLVKCTWLMEWLWWQGAPVKYSFSSSKRTNSPRKPNGSTITVCSIEGSFISSKEIKEFRSRLTPKSISIW